jgi:hypothetical protein
MILFLGQWSIRLKSNSVVSSYFCQLQAKNTASSTVKYWHAVWSYLATRYRYQHSAPTLGDMRPQSINNSVAIDTTTCGSLSLYCHPSTEHFYTGLSAHFPQTM